MQWIFMLVGLVLGALADETLTASLIGALFGLGLAQALRLQGLSRENAALMTQLNEVSKRFAERAAAAPDGSIGAAGAKRSTRGGAGVEYYRTAPVSNLVGPRCAQYVSVGAGGATGGYFAAAGATTGPTQGMGGLCAGGHICHV